MSQIFQEIDSIQSIEISLLLETIKKKYGYDFKDYSKSSIARLVLRAVTRNGFQSIAELQHRLLLDPLFFSTLLNQLTVSVTELFREPEVFLALSQHVFPHLRTYPRLKIWLAGCATGEEAFSLAILLDEAGLLKRSQIYATDINPISLKKAKLGLIEDYKLATGQINYCLAGGKLEFNQYLQKTAGSTTVTDSIRKPIIFSEHSLVSDSSFGEMNLIICRNVLIYFNNRLQNRAFALFYESLERNGFLCLGMRERFVDARWLKKFSSVLCKEQIYRKLPETKH